MFPGPLEYPLGSSESTVPQAGAPARPSLGAPGFTDSDRGPTQDRLCGPSRQDRVSFLIACRSQCLVRNPPADKARQRTEGGPRNWSLRDGPLGKNFRSLTGRHRKLRAPSPSLKATHIQEQHVPRGVGEVRLAKGSGLDPCRARRASAPLPTPLPVQPMTSPPSSKKTNILGAGRLVMQGWRPFLSKQSGSNAALFPPLES